MAGNRLPGDHESADRHTSDLRAETRLSDSLAERFEAYRDDHGVSEAQLLRDALDDYLPSSETSEFVVPTDPELRDAYTTLATPEKKRKLSVEKVESILTSTSHPNTPKSLIREDVIAPLADAGLLGVAGGQVAVHPLTPKDAIDDSEDDDEPEPVADEWDRLDAARADGGER